MSPEQKMWVAVINQAIADATMEDRLNNSDLIERDRARTWLTSSGEDFHKVCALAGFEPSAVWALALKLEASGWQLRLTH